LRRTVRRSGAVSSIAVVVDDFIDRIMGDARLNANPRVDESHSALGITAQEWDASMDDRDQKLTKFSVPDRERDAVVAIVESTKADIVTTAPAAV
jgi:hemoglobin